MLEFHANTVSEAVPGMTQMRTVIGSPTTSTSTSVDTAPAVDKDKSVPDVPVQTCNVRPSRSGLDVFVLVLAVVNRLGNFP